MSPKRILVPVDFSPSSDAALDFALSVADACGAEVEMVYVWSPDERDGCGATSSIFADTVAGKAMEQRLSRADSAHPARLSGRLEFGREARIIIARILEHECFDMVVVPNVTEDAFDGVPSACQVITVPPPAPDETEAA